MHVAWKSASRLAATCSELARAQPRRNHTVFCFYFLYFLSFSFFLSSFFYILCFYFLKISFYFSLLFSVFLPFLLSYTLLFSLFLIFSTLVSFMNKYMSEQTNTPSRFPQYLFWHLPLALCLLMACLQDWVWNFRNLASQRIISITNFEFVFFSLCEGRRSCNVRSNVTTLNEKKKSWFNG